MYFMYNIMFKIILQKEPSPDETKSKDAPKSIPTQSYLTRNLIKESKSIQQVIQTS